MRPIVVNKQDLIDKLSENRQAHVAEYDAAMKGYREAVRKGLIDVLEKVREAARKAEDDKAVDKGEVDLHFSVRGVDRMPESHEADYTRAISMLLWEQRDEIELDETSYRQLVDNEWEWSRQFRATSAAYIGDHGEYPK